MIKSLSNAILVKIRARYAKRLTREDYSNLVSCNKVSDVASYLKNKPIYSESLLRLNDKEIHRGPLESALIQCFFEDLSILAKYDLAFSKKIFKYILTKFEIQQIGKFLVFLKSGNLKKFECFYSDFLESGSKILFKEFNNARTYGDLLKSLAKSDYYSILKSNESDNEIFDINKIETGLYNYLFGIIFESVSKFNAKIREKTKKFLYDCADVANVIRAARSKKFYNSENEYISDIMFQFGDYKFTKFDLLSYSKFSNFDFISSEIKSIQDLERFSKIMKFNWCKKNIRYSNVSEIVGFSYVSLKEIEISNVVNIIEGVRYNLSKEIIEQMLVV
jgi:V/A-type H+-transporting ATPase subunit C